LYSAYQAGSPKFEDKYFELLSAGGSKHHSELLKPFQLDASDPTFWSNGLNLISSMIDELEALEC
jgi:oligoendopeptidase F